MNQANVDSQESSAPVDGQVRVSVRDLWKVFGPAASPYVGVTLRGKSKAAVQDELDSVLALQDVSFDVHQGETFVVMGLSGSGKSTLVRCLIRLIEPTAGEILVDGEDILSYSEEELTQARRQKTGMVLPVLRSVAAPHGDRQRGLGLGSAGSAAGGSACASGRTAADCRAGWLGRVPRCGPQRRHATACRPGACLGVRSGNLADG